MPSSRSNSRSNSRTRKVTSSTRGTELEEFEDARTELSRPSDSSDGIFEGAEPMVAQPGPPIRRPNAPSQEDIMVSNEDLIPAQQHSDNMPPAGYSANPKVCFCRGPLSSCPIAGSLSLLALVQEMHT